jgi:hypothetical protein
MISDRDLCAQLISPEENDDYYARIPMICGPLIFFYDEMQKPSEQIHIFGADVVKFFDQTRQGCPDGVYFLEQYANNKPYALVSNRPFMQTDATDDGDLVDDIPPRPAEPNGKFFILFSKEGAEIEPTSLYTVNPVKASVGGRAGLKTVKVWVPPDHVSKWKELGWDSRKRPAEESTTVAVDRKRSRPSEEPEMNKKRRQTESESTESKKCETYKIRYDLASKRGDTITIDGDIDPRDEISINIVMRNIILKMFSQKDSHWTNITGQEWKYTLTGEAGDTVIELTATPEQPNEIWDIQKVTSTVKVWRFPDHLMLLFPFYQERVRRNRV